MRDFNYTHVGWANVTEGPRVLTQVDDDDTTAVSWTG